MGAWGAIAGAVGGGIVDYLGQKKAYKRNRAAQREGAALLDQGLNASNPMFAAQMNSLRRAGGILDKGYDDAARLTSGVYAQQQETLQREFDVRRDEAIGSLTGTGLGSVVDTNSLFGDELGYASRSLAGDQAGAQAGIAAGKAGALASNETQKSVAIRQRLADILGVSEQKAAALFGQQYQSGGGAASGFGKLGAYIDQNADWWN